MLSQKQKESLARRSAAYDRQRTSETVQSLAGVLSYFSSHAIDGEIAKKYGIGVVVEPEPEDARFTGCIALPYKTSAGVMAIKFRNPGASGAGKYSQLSGQEGRPFNPEALFSGLDRIGICEGEVDAIAATEILGVPSIGVPGAEGWKSHWDWLFREFEEILVFADGDEAGREKFAPKVAGRFEGRARIVSCPDGEDVSSMCAAGRASELLGKDEEE